MSAGAGSAASEWSACGACDVSIERAVAAVAGAAGGEVDIGMAVVEVGESAAGTEQKSAGCRGGFCGACASAAAGAGASGRQSVGTVKSLVDVLFFAVAGVAGAFDSFVELARQYRGPAVVGFCGCAGMGWAVVLPAAILSA